MYVCVWLFVLICAWKSLKMILRATAKPPACLSDHPDYQEVTKRNRFFRVMDVLMWLSLFCVVAISMYALHDDIDQQLWAVFLMVGFVSLLVYGAKLHERAMHYREVFKTN